MLDSTPYRPLFPLAGEYIHLNHAGVSPVNTRALAAMQAFNEQTAHVPFTELLPTAEAAVRDLRERLAALINARSADEIVLMPNTAAGINTAALSLPLRPGDNVLLLDGDYPANIYPWMNLARRGVLAKLVPAKDGGLDLDLLAARIDPRTRAIALSTVQFASGFRNDLEAVGRLCRERGLYFVVDCIQSLGALPFDVQAVGADFVACGSQKWLLGPVGAGFLYVRRERLPELAPGPYVGAFSVVEPRNFLDYNFTLLPTAERFTIGSQNYVGMIGLRASVALIQEIGPARIGERVLALAELAASELAARGFRLAGSPDPARRSGIVIAAVEQPAAAEQRLREARVVAVARGSGIRFAPHFYNTEDEIRRAAAILAEAS
jgi:selenocysteine lyase/cysteine desulfurase